MLSVRPIRNIVTFDQWLARVALGEARTSDLPAIALQALNEGYDSAPLAALAGSSVGEQSPSELQQSLDRALRQLNKRLPTRANAGRILKRYYAKQVAEGALAPRTGVAEIVRLATELSDALPPREYAGDGLGVARLLGLYYSHDDVPWNDDRAHADIDARLVDECRRLATETTA
jgi:hypothetical protein